MKTLEKKITRKSSTRQLRDQNKRNKNTGQSDYKTGALIIGVTFVERPQKGVWFTPEGQDDVMGGYKPKRLI